MTFAVLTLTASAQLYVGGEVGFWREWQDGVNKTNLNINPEVGYNLSENWAIGTTIGYNYFYQEGSKLNAINVAPYARYTFAKLGNVNLFVDGTVGFATYKVKEADGTKGDAQKSWSFGFRPGVSVNLTEKLSFIAHVGFLGYTKSDDSAHTPYGRNGFGFNVDGNDLSFGINYNF